MKLLELFEAITEKDLPKDRGILICSDRKGEQVSVEQKGFGYYFMTDKFDGKCKDAAECIQKLNSMGCKVVGHETRHK